MINYLKYIIFVIGLMWTNYPQTAYSIGVALSFQSVELYNTIDMESQEIWKDIKGYEGYYQISSLGKIKSLRRVINHSHSGFMTIRERILKQSTNPSGYYIIVLNKKNNRFVGTVHRLVAIEFIVNKNNKPQVNHINGIKTDNRVCNLEWCTQSENQKHAFNTSLNKGSRKGKFGKHHNLSKKVNMYTLDNKYVNTFYGISEAFRETGINHRCISNVCLGKQKKAGGYIWEYENDKIKKL